MRESITASTISIATINIKTNINKSTFPTTNQVTKPNRTNIRAISNF